MRSARPAALLALCGALGACGDEPEYTCPGGAGENVLVIVSDDIGIDKTSAYHEHESAPPGPNIEALAAEGLLFRSAYACPTCSPTRAALLTGRLPSRTGVGRWIAPDEAGADLPLSELTLAEMLRRAPVCTTTGLVGKWHLVDFSRENPAAHPLAQGFSTYSGSLANPQNSLGDDGEEHGYSHWEKDDRGELGWSDTYMATDTTDEALAFMASAPEPWVLVVAYNLAHVPVHVPPGALNLAGVTERSTDLEKMEAMVMALDAEVGRLLDGLPSKARERTTIAYLSDNGTVPGFIEPPWNPGRGKGTTYDGGVRVPLIIAGPHVSTPGEETDALVHVADLFPTIAEIAGVDPGALTFEEGEHQGEPIPLDGVSLLPLLEDPSGEPPRATVYTEGFYPNGVGAQDWARRMIRNSRYKLTQEDHAGAMVNERLYRYQEDAIDEGYDLLAGDLDAEAAAAYDELSAALDSERAELDLGG